MTMCTLYVGGLEQDVDAGFLRSTFSAFGPVQDARVIVRPTTGCCRGFGYVTFQSPNDATRARAALDGSEVEGQRLRVEIAR